MSDPNAPADATHPADADLDTARLRGDPEADAVITELFAQGGVTGANTVFARLRQGGALGADAPPVLKDWLERTGALPDWFEPDAAKAGGQLFERMGVAAVMALFNRALPQTYACRPIARVLGGTRRLTQDAPRRINETARLVLDVGDPNGFGPGGHAIRACQQVRLVHAAVRHHLRATPGAWDDADGVPLNQEDQALTLQGFSSSTLDALMTMGYDFTPAEAHGYMHVWRVAGHLLGVEPAWLPESVEAGLALVERISARHDERSDEGVALTLALLEVERNLIPGTFADGCVPVILRWLLGERRADLLGVAPMPFASAITRPLHWINHLVDEVGDDHARVARFVGAFNHALMNGVHQWYLTEHQQPLRIPSRLVLDGVELTPTSAPRA